MKTVVILHDMVVEERQFAEYEEGHEFSGGIAVLSVSLPMWHGLVPLSGAMHQKAPGMFIAEFKLERFSKNMQENNLKNRFLIDHLWS